MMTLINTTSCSKKGNNGANPFFEKQWDTPFGTPPFNRIAADHYEPAFERAMSLQNAEIAAITSNKERPTFENTVAEFDRSGELLTRVSDIFEMMCAANSSDAMRAIEERVMPRLASHADAILMNDELFERIKQVYDTRESCELDAEQKRLTERLYNRFVRAGALLSEEDKSRLKEINSELSLLSVRFGQNVLGENNDYRLLLKDNEVNDLPASVREAAAAAAKEIGESGKFLFTLQQPSMIPLLTYSTHRDLREKIYTAYLRRCGMDNEYDNRKIIDDMLRLRNEKAHLLGYDSFAHYVTAEQMSGSPEAVYALLNDVWTPALKRATSELEEMKKLFRRDFPHSGNKFQSWDWWYYAEKVRKQQYALDDEKLRPYFSLENVRQGIFDLANRLYGITFRPVAVDKYHDDVTAFKVVDANEAILGILYFDFHPRSSKSQGAWCGYFRRQRYSREGERTTPHVSIVCNFTPPTDKAPSLLSLDEVTTLFHEFGHALHFLFTDVRYNGLIDVEGDFVELPSQIMENWALEPEMLRSYAVHNRSGAIIPDDLIAKIGRSSKFNQGFATTELIAAALIDMDAHSIAKYDSIDVREFEKRALYTERKLIPQIEPRYHLSYFRHIFAGGYSAGYYFYTWAEVLDKDAYASFVETGDRFNSRQAEKLRRLLASGGKKDGMTLYREFRGQEPSRTPLLISRGLCEAPTEVEEALVAAPNDSKVLDDLRHVAAEADAEDAREAAKNEEPTDEKTQDENNDKPKNK